MVAAAADVAAWGGSSRLGDRGVVAPKDSAAGRATHRVAVGGHTPRAPAKGNRSWRVSFLLKK